MGCVSKEACHKCGGMNSLQVYEEGGNYTGFCFRPQCMTYFPDPYGDKPEDWTPPKGTLGKSAEEREAECKEISEEWGVHDLPSRELKKEYLDYFGVKVGVSEEDGMTPTIVALPVKRDGSLVSYKMRLLEEKRMWSLGDSGSADLFGWDQAVATGAPRLIICEGEYDAIALTQVLKEGNRDPAYADFWPAVVSLANGSGSARKEVQSKLDLIKSTFKDVVLAFDMDEAGDEAALAVCKILPEAMRAKLPAKDANACLQEGRSKALRNSVLFKASVQKNSRLVYGSALKDVARKEAQWGRSFPWQALTKQTRGERNGETYYWGAGVKMGKSELLNALAAHNVINHGKKVFLAKPEEANGKTYKMMVGKAANRIFHDPTIEFDYEAFDKYEPLIGDNVVMLDLYQHLTWDHVKGDIIHAASEGYDVVYLDPITNFTNQLGTSEANEMLVAISAEAAAMAADHNLAMHFFCHLNAPPRGSQPHEMGGQILSNQFAGSRAMMRSCNYMLGLEGNKDPELSQAERNCRQIVLLEDREFGQVGKTNLFWDSKTGAFNEMGGE
tara:strand:+ start:9966 stop:11636 length:1671 start_codon:yes stop_codon:yes gene_type:complete